MSATHNSLADALRALANAATTALRQPADLHAIFELSQEVGAANAALAQHVAQQADAMHMPSDQLLDVDLICKQRDQAIAERDALRRQLDAQQPHYVANVEPINGGMGPNWDEVRLKTGHVLQISDEGITVWPNEAAYQSADNANVLAGVSFDFPNDAQQREQSEDSAWIKAAADEIDGFLYQAYGGNSPALGEIASIIRKHVRAAREATRNQSEGGAE